MYYAPFRRCTHRVAPVFSLDLHVLGTPPTFVLSQDQTLQSAFVDEESVWFEEAPGYSEPG